MSGGISPLETDSAEQAADRAEEHRSQDDHRTGRVPATAIYHDIARIVERMHRRFLDVVRVELGRVGIDDISPVQVLMLMNIGTEELSVRDLMERGYYLGSNASYNLKQLVETGYVDRAPSLRDRRSARLRLSEKGMSLCAELRRLEATQADVLIRTDEDNADFDITYRTLRRLERAWSDIIRYDGREFD
ncbi:transcriptional regulator [Skermanella stibiiresistens SB22]|uniref:Transcriptional regulator n=1 Tax=Skermanella stibiiresistens SB22 TaxID=1385369 RepID=W9H4P1_9PROT|nr:MarR family transcriptional regulator [Skermanella stibiiresistens]EWY39657.1 transcriptional regulator [Skermanella stibiiresistens SB22]